MSLTGKARSSAKTAGVTRVDLHLHSRFSQESDLWILRQAGVGESNTDPETAYQVCKNTGMTYVTLTDHNTIEGALRLAHHPDFFISEEVTTYFPGEDVKLHALALGISEDQHRDIQELRPNLYDLVSYFNQEEITYVLAHPLTRLGGELTRGHIERLMLLFPRWEVHNGSTLERENSMSRRLAERCSAELLMELAEKHNLEPVTTDRISFTAGSDDHAGYDLASAWTETGPANSIADFLAEVKAGRTHARGAHGSTLKLAHTMLGLLAQSVEDMNKKEKRHWGKSLASLATPGLNGSFASARKWTGLLALAVGDGRAAGVLKAAWEDADLRNALIPVIAESAKGGSAGGETYHNRLFSLVSAAWAAGVRSTLGGLSDLSLFNLVDNFDKIGKIVALQTLLLPHSLAANYHSRQRHFLIRLNKEIFPDEPEDADLRPLKVGLFTDTFDEVNGATSILRRLEEHCDHKSRPLDIICFGERAAREGRVFRFPAVASVNLPEYGELNLGVPPLLEIVKHCEEREYDVIHAATPGPMGFAAFLAAKILQVPLVTSYHTDVPRCIGRITDDKLNEEVAWTFTRWFYQRSDMTFVPSMFTVNDLDAHGLDRRQMVVQYQGIDTDRFSPESRSDDWRRRLGGGDGKKIILFVGRLSQEKDLHFLAECYLDILDGRDDVHLAIVGDGPDRGQLEQLLGGSATFTGWLNGQDLAAAFASADLFVFPSSVDTSGQVVLEAQASGLPAIVCAESGACENIMPGISGLTAPNRSLAGFRRQIERLLDDEEARAAMSREATRSAQSRTWQKVFDSFFASYAELLNWWQPLSVIRGDAGQQGRSYSPLAFFGAAENPAGSTKGM